MRTIRMPPQRSVRDSPLIRFRDGQELLSMTAPVHIGSGYEQRPAESLDVHESKVIVDRHVTPASRTGILSNEGYSAVQGPPPPRLALSASLTAHACSAASCSAGDIAQPTKTPPTRGTLPVELGLGDVAMLGESF